MVRKSGSLATGALLASLCFWGLSASVPAQPAADTVKIDGMVLVSATQEPVAGATVFLLPPGGHRARDAQAQVLTDEQGRFAIEAAAGACGIRVEAAGHLPWSDGAIILPAGQPRTLRVLLQPTGAALRAEVGALRLAWEEQDAQAQQLTPEQEQALQVLQELQQAVNSGDADRALALFSPTHFRRVDLGREAGEREPKGDLMVLSAPDYPALETLLRKAIADGLRLKLINPAVAIRGKWAEAEVVAVAALGRSTLAELRQIALIHEGDRWRISQYTAPPDPLVTREDELARAAMEQAERADEGVETEVLLFEKVSYEFPHSRWGVGALREAIEAAGRSDDLADEWVNLCGDLLRRYPRPPGLYWFAPGVEGEGWYGRFTLYEARRDLADALYRSGLVEEAEEEYRRCLGYFPDGADPRPLGPVRERLALIGQHDGREREALRLFAEGSYAELIAQFPHSDLVDNTLLELARSAREPEEARLRYEEIIQDHPDGDCVDDALYGIAETHCDAIDWRNSERSPQDAERALSRYQEIIDRFPEGDTAGRAQRRVDEIQKRLAGLDERAKRQADEEAVAADPQAALTGLRSEDAETRRAAVEALAAGPADTAAETLAPLVSDPDASVRESVAWALGKIGTEPAIAALRNLLTDQEENVRARAELAILETQYTGDVVERPYDHWALPGRRFSMAGGQQPFVYEARGIRSNTVCWIGYACISPGLCLSDRMSARYPVWGPERKDVVYVASTWPGSDEHERDDLFVVSADGLSERRLTVTGDVVGRPQWWPGQQVLFCRQDRHATTIWIKDFAGEKQMTDRGRAWHPTYSPDGARIAYIHRPQPNVTPSLWTMSVGTFPPVDRGETVDDADKRQLVDGVRPAPPAWSPDGRSIAFTDAQGCLSTVEVQTGAVRQLTQAQAFAQDVSPAWSPQGDVLVFVRQAADAHTLWVVRSDRPGEQPLTAGRRFDEDPQFEGEWSEGGQGERVPYHHVYYCTSPDGQDGEAGQWRQHMVTFRWGE